MTRSKRRQEGPSQLARAISAGDFPAARRILAASDVADKLRPPRPERGPISLAEACGGKDVNATVAGRQVRYHKVRRTLDQWLEADAPDIEREFVAVLRGARQRMDELAASPALCHAANARPEDLLLVSPWQPGPTDPVLFLVSVMFCLDRRLTVEHYLARDERGEAGICGAFADRCTRAGVLVTFSAKRSVRKHLADRCELHGVDLTAEAWDAPTSRQRAGRLPHLDLRKECRTRWRGQLRTCSLPMFERTLLGRAGPNLVPRAAAQDACRDFIATGDARNMPSVLARSTRYLATMARLVCRLLTGCEGDGQ